MMSFQKQKTYPVIKKIDPNSVQEVNAMLEDGRLAASVIPCKLCSSTQYKVLFENDCYGILCKTVVCKSCGFVFLNPQLTAQSSIDFYESDHYRNLADGKNLINISLQKYKECSIQTEKPNDPNKWYRRRFFDFLKPHFSKFKTIADIGTGGGWKLIPFIESGFHPVGFEIGSVLADLGRKQGVDIRVKPEDHEKFDLVMYNHVLEHLLDPREELHRIKKHITENGYLFIEVPGFSRTIPSIQFPHVQYFSMKTMRELLTETGYEVVDSEVVPNNGNLMILSKVSSPQNPKYSKSEYLRVLYVYYRFWLKRLLSGF